MKTMEVWKKVQKGRRMAATTKVHYGFWMGKFAEFSGEWPVTKGAINEFLASLGKYADTTVASAYSVLKACGEHMWQNYEMSNPVNGVEKPHIKKKRRRYFTVDEFFRLLGCARTNENRLLILVLLDSSARVGDIDDLKGGDIDEKLGKLRVRLGKTGEITYRCLPRLCDEMKKQAAGNAGGFVWSDGNGGYVFSGALSARIRRIAINAGLGHYKVGAHTLRHSAASIVAKFTENPMMVQELLQHTDVKMSMQYVHDAADAIGDVSPLQIAMDSKKEAATEGQFLMLPSGEASEEAGFVEMEAEIEDDGLEDSLRVVNVGVSVRPLLKDVDLELIRMAFISYARNGGLTSRGSVINLYNRMIRKVR